MKPSLLLRMAETATSVFGRSVSRIVVTFVFLCLCPMALWGFRQPWSIADSISVVPAAVAELKVGETSPWEFELVNGTSLPLRIVGSAVSCGCLKLSPDAFPIEIESRGRTMMRVRLDGGSVPAEPSVTLFTDNKQFARIVVCLEADH